MYYPSTMLPTPSSEGLVRMKIGNEGKILMYVARDSWNVATQEDADWHGVVLDSTSLCKRIAPHVPIVKQPGFGQAMTVDDKREVVSMHGIVDGTMVRTFWSDGKWFHTTNSMLDAKNAFWSDPTMSFYDQWVAGMVACGREIDDLYDKLDKQMSYVWIVVHPHTRHVIKYDAPAVYFAGAVRLDGEERLDAAEVPADIPRLSSVPVNKCGFVEVSVGAPGRFNRIIWTTPEYRELQSLRGNTTNIDYQCVVVLKHGQEDAFVKAFPEFAENMQRMEQSVLKVVEIVHAHYMRWYVKKIQDEDCIMPEFKTAIAHAHKRYVYNRQVVTRDVVLSVLMGYSPKRLYAMTDLLRVPPRATESV